MTFPFAPQGRPKAELRPSGVWGPNTPQAVQGANCALWGVGPNTAAGPPQARIAPLWVVGPNTAAAPSQGANAPLEGSKTASDNAIVLRGCQKTGEMRQSLTRAGSDHRSIAHDASVE